MFNVTFSMELKFVDIVCTVWSIRGSEIFKFVFTHYNLSLLINIKYSLPSSVA